MSTSKIARCVLTDSIAIVILLITGLVVARFMNVPSAILFIQILAAELLCLAYPISTLQHDGTKKSKRQRKHVQIEIIAFGCLGAFIAYASYLLFFAYHVVSPAYVDVSSSLYMQATAVTLITFVFCQTINLAYIRADDHTYVLTDYLLANKKLLTSFGISLILLLNIVYNPLFQSVFHTAALSPVEWAAAIVCAGIYALLRRLQRYTRKHSRHSVVKLHKEVHG